MSKIIAETDFGDFEFDGTMSDTNVSGGWCIVYDDNGRAKAYVSAYGVIIRSKDDGDNL